MRIVVALIALAGISGCQTTGRVPIVVPKNVPIEIPEGLLRCVRIKYPNADTLTDKQVARLLVSMDSALRECVRNMEGIREFQARVKKRLAS
jgi:hypothetical protein